MSKLGPIQEPDLAALLDMTRQRIFADLNCHRVGIIQSFDNAKGTATVSIASQALVGDQVYAYPLLVDCPVFVNWGGVGGLTIPIRNGDTCLVLFNDRNIDSWFSTGSVVPPNTQRMHSLADGLVLVGFRSMANPVPAWSNSAVQLRNDAEGAMISLDSLVDIRNNVISLFDILQNMLTTMETWTTTTGLTANPATLARVSVNRTEVDSLIKN